MLVVCVLVPVVQCASTGPHGTFVVPGLVIWMFPPRQVQEAGKLHEMASRVGEQDFKLLVCVWAREADSLHAQVDRHCFGARLVAKQVSESRLELCFVHMRMLLR